jgi:MoaA/NifB/PqqE/SkfB family radical SAM enzyme
MRTTVTTNGFFLTEDRLTPLKGLIDVLAISLDGRPETHNRIRQHPRAFERLESGLPCVRRAGIPFGIIHTVTAANWEELLWVADFAASNGAKLFQIHPLEMTGRAGVELTADEPDSDLLAKIYLLAFAIQQKYAGTMKVQIDLLYSEHLREIPSLVYAGEEDNASPREATDMVGLLVLEPDGAVVPVSYGFSRRYAICNAKQQRLAAAWKKYERRGYPEFRSLCHALWEDLAAPGAPLLINWHEAIVARSNEFKFVELARLAS